MIALPIYLQMVLEYNAMRGRPVACAAVAHDVRGRAARRRSGPAGGVRACIIRAGFAAARSRHGDPDPDRPAGDSGWYLAIPLIVAGCGLGLLVSQLNNYTLSPISEERVSEAAGVNSAGGLVRLSFGLAFAGAIMLAALSLTFTHMADVEHGAAGRRSNSRSRTPSSTTPR